MTLGSEKTREAGGITILKSEHDPHWGSLSAFYLILSGCGQVYLVEMSFQSVKIQSDL